MKSATQTRPRSKSLELGIKTIEDITNFFDNLKVDRRGAKVAKLEEEKTEKRFSLPEIEKKRKTRKTNQNLLPELVVTCPDE